VTRYAHDVCFGRCMPTCAPPSADIPAQILNPWVWNVDSGGLKFKRHIPWLWHSGVIVAVIATVTPFVTKFVPPPDPRQGKAPLMSGLPLDDGTLNVWTAEWENSPGTVRRNYARNKVRLVSRVHRVLQLSLSEVRKKVRVLGRLQVQHVSRWLMVNKRCCTEPCHEQLEREAQAGSAGCV